MSLLEAENNIFGTQDNTEGIKSGGMNLARCELISSSLLKLVATGCITSVSIKQLKLNEVRGPELH